MTIITPVSEFEILGPKDLVSLECGQCEKAFTQPKRRVDYYLNSSNPKHKNCLKFCSPACSRKGRVTSPLVACAQCGKTFSKTKSQIAKTLNNFCSQSCACTYNNAHKTKGCRRSKFEAFLEESLVKLYPQIAFKFNEKTEIMSELDIFIPELKLAVELNGIFHYEPIYGQNKLDQTKNNDGRKLLACAERGIELLILDISSIKYFKPSKVQPFLDIIGKIIDQKLARKTDDADLVPVR